MKSSKLLVFALALALKGYAEEPTSILSFPIFASDNRELMAGYGDWCGPEEGPHPGIDFYADEGDYVLNPFDQTMYVLGAGYNENQINTGCILGIGGAGDYWGWALKHLEHYGDPEGWCEGHLRNMPIATRAPIEACIQYSTVPRHLHIDWSFWVEFPGHPEQAYIPWGFHEFVNPFDYFSSTQLIGYDLIEFKKVLYAPFNTGVWFMPDGAEIAAQFPAIIPPGPFQDVVFRKVDIAVSPFSSLVSYPNNNSSGVYSVGYEILRQNTLLPDCWESTASTEGLWGFRELFRAFGQTPYDINDGWDTDEYRALFVDGYLVGGSGTQPHPLFESAYIVTNSGVPPTSDWDVGWNNVWTDPSNDNWVDGICRGAWNTFLAKPSITGDPLQNSEAFFPDGRYAVDITAESHGSREEITMRLPVDDLSLPNPTVEGVIVDNFFPYIEEIIVYTFDPQSILQHATVIYNETWELDPTRTYREIDSVATGYLSNCGRDILGIAVRYSEVMDSNNLGVFCLTGSWADEIIYSSLIDRPRWLVPVDGFRDLRINPTGSESFYWQCYETSGACNLSNLGYIGRLSIHIGNESSPFFSLDLAGNEMDYDPSTLSEIESGPYDSGSWGVPNWSLAGEFAYGAFGGQLVAELDLSEPCGDLAGWKDLGDCPYYCGFYIYAGFWVPPYLSEFHVWAFKPDGSYLDITVPTTYTYIGNPEPRSYNHFWSQNTQCFRIAESGNKIWISWYDKVRIDEYVYPVTGWLACYDIVQETFVYWNAETSFTDNFHLSGNYVDIQQAIDNDGVHVKVQTSPYPYVYEEYDVYPNRDIAVNRTSDTEDIERNSEQTTAIELINDLHSPIPNPAGCSVTISYTLAEQGLIQVVVYDIAGHIVNRLVDDVMIAGNHDIVWELTSTSNERIPSGLYYVRMLSESFNKTENLVVLR